MSQHKLSNLQKAILAIGKEHALYLQKAGDLVSREESAYHKMFKHVLHSFDEYVADYVLKFGMIPKKLDSDLIASTLFEMYYRQALQAWEIAKGEAEFLTPPQLRLRSKPPKIKVPKSLRELQKLWDLYRKKGQIPARQKELATAISKGYLKKVQDVWRKTSEQFRSGEIANQQEALQVIRKASDGVFARAKTIVQTETTNYYNKVRREIYDESDAVTHYLFLAIRDQATTKWCTDATRDGKRGRHGLVYAKGDPLTEQETPAVHWNCRSEMVPLVPYNPRHQKLIDNKSIQRRNKTCWPLPKGWNK